MPTTYACDNCGQTATSLDGWYIVSVMFLHTEPNLQPSGRTLDSTAPDLLFHAVTCRDVWCTKAGVASPVTGTP
jgi:hypothetical protein